jgi:predicted metal-dependent hydrolase
MKKSILVGDLQFEVRQSMRRRTCALTVDRGGELIVHAPASASSADLRDFIQPRLLWVHRKLNLKRQAVEVASAPLWVTGQGINYMGRSYRLRLLEDADEPLRLQSGWWELRRRDRERAVIVFRKWFIQNGSDWVCKRVASLAGRLDVKPSIVRVRDLGSRWGSCTASGGVLFNWMLLQLPGELIEYVILHELAHLKHRRHDASFWSALEGALPDYERRKEKLRTEGPRYMQFNAADFRVAS